MNGDTLRDVSPLVMVGAGVDGRMFGKGVWEDAPLTRLVKNCGELGEAASSMVLPRGDEARG